MAAGAARTKSADQPVRRSLRSKPVWNRDGDQSRQNRSSRGIHARFPVGSHGWCARRASDARAPMIRGVVSLLSRLLALHVRSGPGTILAAGDAGGV